MTIIKLDPVGTTTMLSLTSTIESALDDEEAKATLITGLTTSLSTTTPFNSRNYIYMDTATRYVDSLTDDELMRLDNLLKEREEQIVEIEFPKKPIDKEQEELLQLEEKVKKTLEKETPAIPTAPEKGNIEFRGNIKIKKKK